MENLSTVDSTADAATKGYVDQVVTVSPTDPDPVLDVPVRDGLVWYTVGEPPPPPPTLFAGTFGAVDNLLSWVDSTDAAATYEIRYNLTAAPVTATDVLLGTGIAAGAQAASHTKDAAALAAPEIFYGIKAMGAGGESPWMQCSVLKI